MFSNEQLTLSKYPGRTSPVAHSTGMLLCNDVSTCPNPDLKELNTTAAMMGL